MGLAFARGHDFHEGKPAGALATVRDSWRQIANSYGAQLDDLMLVRPDGYLGLCAERPDAEQLRRYFVQLTGRT